MSKNDDKIMMLKKSIEAKKEEIGQIHRFSPITSCSIELDGTRYNLHSADRSSLILLLCKLHNLDTTAEILGYPNQCTIGGFSTYDWISDIQDRLAIIAQKEKLQQLKAMEAQLDKLLSDDKKAELEIESIAAALGL